MPAADRLADLARRALYAASLLEREPALGDKLRFATNELLFRINDRLAAPNDDATWARYKPEIESLAERVFAGHFELTRSGGPKELFAVRVTTSGSAPLGALLDRVGGPPGPDASLAPAERARHG